MRRQNLVPKYTHTDHMASVVRSDGTREAVSFDKILARVRDQCDGLAAALGHPTR